MTAYSPYRNTRRHHEGKGVRPDFQRFLAGHGIDVRLVGTNDFNRHWEYNGLRIKSSLRPGLRRFPDVRVDAAKVVKYDLIVWHDETFAELTMCEPHRIPWQELPLCDDPDNLERPDQRNENYNVPWRYLSRGLPALVRILTGEVIDVPPAPPEDVPPAAQQPKLF